MQGLGDEFFAGAALSRDQDGGARGPRLLDEGVIEAQAYGQVECYESALLFARTESWVIAPESSTYSRNEFLGVMGAFWGSAMVVVLEVAAARTRSLAGAGRERFASGGAAAGSWRSTGVSTPFGSVIRLPGRGTDRLQPSQPKTASCR
mgnify:CR=1 FL=1